MVKENPELRALYKTPRATKSDWATKPEQRKYTFPGYLLLGMILRGNSKNIRGMRDESGIPKTKQTVKHSNY